MSQYGRQGRTLYADALNTATDIVAETGQMPQMAELADKLDVPENSLCGIFGSEQQLLVAIAENAMMLLHDQCVRTIVKVNDQDPVAQFQALSDAYIEWAYNHPREFRIIGSMPAEDFQHNDKLMRYEQSIHELMLRLLMRAKSMGKLSQDENLPLLIAAAHSFAYGLVSKMLLGDLARWAPEHDELTAARAAMHMFTSRVLCIQSA
ncbi:TetR-like C-terminal domain-containing protein [Paracoccus laeviglucosivorans]|uniref:HTH-type transcriptional regulator MT1864/Rv1816-like C-terminal domain-containing protein n=1 Tax=Paracoccus laeviglucosivorans TaxID=1197861 RepID=A0A521BCD2_9RHOB|nr:TetR-like C-terminal domain-containing protein [Paracoccus laeviglucosivorans]SMO44743.1 hypothetical protein SAMN06265221_102223 [Paracoccus laeviglucosivorans]